MLFSYLKVLCFNAYFQEAVPQRREEKYNVRKCKIYFYLEDDTIQVVEPELKNSGIPQGKYQIQMNSILINDKPVKTSCLNPSVLLRNPDSKAPHFSPSS